jgi:type IV pilus assembly protein PilM
MSQLPVWGIDVTSSTLAAVKLSLAEDGAIRAEAWDVVDFAEDVEDVRGVGRYDAIRKAVKRFLKLHDLRFAKTVVSIRGEAAFMRTVVVPQLEGESLEKILAFEAQQQIPYALEEVYWDRRVLAIRDGGEVVVSLYAILKQQVDDRLRKLGVMGLPIDAVQLRPVALQNFCAAEKLLDDGTIVVDVDYAGTQILAVDDGRVWFRCLPAGGADFVARLTNRLRLQHAAAVRLASGRAEPKPGAEAKAFQELRAAASRDLSDEIASQIRYYLRSHPNAKAERLLLFVQHAACPPVEATLAAATGLSVTRPRGFRSFEVDVDVVGAGLQENFASLARAAGLALQGLGRADTDIRLYPETIPRSFGRPKGGYAAAAAAAAALVALMWLRVDAERDAIAAAANALHARVVDALRFDPARIRAEGLRGDPIAPTVEKWTARARGREGPLPFLDALFAELVAARGGSGGIGAASGAPLLVAFEAGDPPGRSLAPHAARMKLAFVETLKKKGLVVEAKPIETYSAAAPTIEKPASADEKLLRFRFRHRKYDLRFGGSS